MFGGPLRDASTRGSIGSHACMTHTMFLCTATVPAWNAGSRSDRAFRSSSTGTPVAAKSPSRVVSVGHRLTSLGTVAASDNRSALGICSQPLSRHCTRCSTRWMRCTRPYTRPGLSRPRASSSTKWETSESWLAHRPREVVSPVRVCLAGSARKARLGVTDEHQAGHLYCMSLSVAVGGMHGPLGAGITMSGGPPLVQSTSGVIPKCWG